MERLMEQALSSLASSNSASDGGGGVAEVVGGIIPWPWPITERPLQPLFNATSTE